MSATSAAQRRIAGLAALTPVHRAFHWLHLHQPQLRQWQLDLVRIPAPPFGEAARGAWVMERFQHLGLSNVHTDEAGNVLGELSAACHLSTPGHLPTPDHLSTPGHLPTPGHSERSEEPPHFSGRAVDASSLTSKPIVLISAHLDTVFPAGTHCEPIEPPDTARIYAPGICDNVAGLTGLLAIAAALRYAGIGAPAPILFAANVGEEGEGDLRGMRHLFERGAYANRIAAAIILEGSGSSAVVTRALGSLRFRITVAGPGGHSWSDAGAPNPILILSRVLLQIADIELPDDPLTTLNVGSISGGTSINSIPERATALLDLRSTDPAQLTSAEVQIRQVIECVSATAAIPKIQMETIGSRPAAALPADSPILHTLRAVDRHLTLRTEPRLGSTDANIPLCKGIPAIAIGTGGAGGGIHTLQEWYDPTGRETALRRVLLTILDTAQLVAENRDA